MSMRSNYLNRKLNEHGYKTDLKNYAILDINNKIIKKYIGPLNKRSIEEIKIFIK
jgi:hypothetical protein